MKNKYYTPEIIIENLEKRDVLCDSQRDNSTLNSKTRQMDLLTFIEDFVFTE